MTHDKMIMVLKGMKISHFRKDAQCKFCNYDINFLRNKQQQINTYLNKADFKKFNKSRNFTTNYKNIQYLFLQKRSNGSFTDNIETIISIKEKMNGEKKKEISSENMDNDIIDLERSEIWGNENIKLHFQNGIFEVSLNRPEKLNAINKDMLNILLNTLKSLDTDDRCNLIILKSTSPKAFSAGSDVKFIVSHKEEGIRFLKQLYLYINYLCQMKTNVLCIWNGFVMGGGIGISIGSKFRVVNKSVSFAMPENKIGFFPDIGSVHFLHKYFGRNITLHLGITGMSINEQDLINFRIATNYVNDVEPFLKDLYQIEYKNKMDFDNNLKKVLQKHSKENSETSPILSNDLINNINHYYSSANNLTQLIDNLKADEKKNPFCKSLLNEINSHCFFTSSFWFSYCLFNFSKCPNFNQVLDNDFKITQYFLFHLNTFEKGVTERLINKNIHFKWEKTDTGGNEKFIENEKDVEEILQNKNLVSILDEFI